MKIIEILVEAKSRISHPEDMVFDAGYLGAMSALDSLIDAASSTKNISLKFDGSPALLCGYQNGKFVLTDKSGWNQKKFASSTKSVYDMLFNRKADQPGRAAYSQQVATLFPYIQKLVPKSFAGFLQFDVMWFSRPELVDGAYQFQPNTVIYRIPADTDLGVEISNSQVGIAVHSYFENGEEDEPRGISDINSLGLSKVPGLVVLNPRATVEIEPNLKLVSALKKTKAKVATLSKPVDLFLDRETLTSQKITDLPTVMKQYLAVRSRAGKGINNIGTEFIEWLNSNNKISDKKKINILEYIKKNFPIYNRVWSVAVAIVNAKHLVLNVIDKAFTSIEASIHGEKGQEGYVVDAPTGKIKIVNRPLFMKKEEN